MTFTIRATAVVVLGATLAFTLAACGRSSKSSYGDTASAGGNVAASSPSRDSASSANTMVRGKIVAVSDSDLTVQSDSGTVRVALEQPVKVFDRQASTLDRVTSNTFVGVTSVKQPDGSERATEIHIFPEALRGLGEGSRPMTQSGAGESSTMTNGSTMSNGTVQSGAGTTIVVQYNGGSKTIDVPANTPVTEIAVTSAPLAVGQQFVVVASRGANGTLSSNRVLAARK